MHVLSMGRSDQFRDVWIGECKQFELELEIRIEIDELGFAMSNQCIVDLFGFLSEKEVDEIEEYHMHISKENDEASHSTQYTVHNLHTMYDISFYTNMIDIHIDDNVSINLNTYQLNALITLLNHFLDTDSPTLQTVSSEMIEMERSPIEPPPPSELLQPLEDRAEAVSAALPMSPKFNVNSIALYVGTLHFTYSMPRNLLPSAYQVTADNAIPVMGEGKEPKKEVYLSTLSVPFALLYCVDCRKTMHKSVLEMSIGGMEFVANLYDNQFYSADCIFVLRDVCIWNGIHF